MTPTVQTRETEMSSAIVPPLAGFFAPVAVVSPSFVDLRDPYCLHCGEPGWGQMIHDDQIARDAGGEHLDCPKCGAQYRPRGGVFRSQGESRPERWCGRCEAWRVIGRNWAQESVHSCIACGHAFDMRVVPPEQALMDARRQTLASDTTVTAKEG